MSRAIVLDTDMASDVDDALCLALALAAPELELLGITNVGRESALRARVDAEACSSSRGATEIPVYAGCRVPLLAGAGFNWFGHEGEGILEPGSRAAARERARGRRAARALARGAPGSRSSRSDRSRTWRVALAKDPDFAARVGAAHR